MTRKPAFRGGPPRGTLVVSKKIEPPKELDGRLDLLETINKMLEDSNSMTLRKRHAYRRVATLKKLKNNLTTYQELLMEQQVTLKQMRLALDREIAISDC